MPNKSAESKNIITAPEFRLAWGAVALLAGAFVIDIFFLPLVFIAIEAALCAVAAVFIFISLYAATKIPTIAPPIGRSDLESVLGSFDDALVIYDNHFKVSFFNAAAEQLFKVSRKDMIGHILVPQDIERPGWQTLIQVIFPSLAPRVMSRSKEGEYPEVVDLSFTDPQFEFRVTTSPIVQDNGKTPAFIKIIRDRTSEIGALRSNTEFITVASHQLRGPLTDISWAFQTLLSSGELNETDKAIVSTAAAAGRGLLRRIDDLLDVAKMDEGHFGYNFEDADIVEFLGKILSDVLPQARTAGVKIYFDRPSEALPHVMIDPKQLSMAVVNIMENAIRYNVTNGEVVVKVQKETDKPFIDVSVRDTGIGIPPEGIKKIFTKFFRSENAVKSQTEGSGLGLYIAKGIVNAHGGEIRAESEVNRGTIITFTIPTDPNLVPKRETGAEYI